MGLPLTELLEQLKNRPPTRKERRQLKAARARGKMTARMRRHYAAKAMERYGLDELAPDGSVSAIARIAMRNARKAERALPAPVFPVTRAPGCAEAKRLAIAGKRPRFILRQHAATCGKCRTALLPVGNG
jgi:hypothetical protein